MFPLFGFDFSKTKMKNKCFRFLCFIFLKPKRKTKVFSFFVFYFTKNQLKMKINFKVQVSIFRFRFYSKFTQKEISMQFQLLADL